MPKVSIIVPVYNVEKYLRKCIDSIISQTLSDIEILCIDDGSNDASGKILDEYAIQDERIKVIHKANEGYGVTMNVGLEIATGEYIGIVESDDCVLPEMFKVLYESAKKHELDMVKSDAYYWIEQSNFLGRIHVKHLDAYYDRVLDGLDRNIFFSFYMNIWTGIYKKSFLDKNDIKFNETSGASYQDNGFWMQTCAYAMKAMWLSQAFYYYRQDNPMASVKSKEKMMTMSLEYDHIEKTFKKRGDDYLLPYCYSVKLFRHMGTYKRISDELKLEYCKKIMDDYLMYSPYIRENRYLDDFLLRLIRKPEIETEELINKKHYVIERLAKANHIILYGAGQFASQVYRILFNEGYLAKMRCFAVTNKIINDVIGEKCVKYVDDVLKEYPNDLFIIAVPTQTSAYRDMSLHLKINGVGDYLDGELITSSFYLV